jgi:hypoxanthine phosphoribosyltransferase
MTLTPAKLRELSSALYQEVRADGYRPDAVVGIATGGVHVVDAMGLTPEVLVTTCRLRRPSSQAKEVGLAQRVLRSLPTPVSDRLRLVEDKWLERKAAVPSEPTTELLNQVERVSMTLEDAHASRILVVDDAVDSGATLKCVLDLLVSRLPHDKEVRSAVLTVTRSADRRCVTPDYALFDSVLLRFPWSNDYKTAAANR